MTTDTNLYWNVRGTYDERKQKLQSLGKDYLEAAILDAEYNDFLRERSNYEDKDTDPHGHGKRLPYIGWYWRHITFHDLTSIPIGDCGNFIGFMANNKWYYNERTLTEEEGRKVMAIIDEAMRLNQQGGVISEIVASVNEKLEELWALMQTFKV